MGACQCVQKGGTGDTPGHPLIPGEHFILEIRRGASMPKADVLSESDPFAVVWLRDPSSGLRRGVKVWTRALTDEVNPSWFSLKDLKAVPAPTDELHIEVYDMDELKQDELLGSADLPISALQPNRETDIQLAPAPEFQKSQHRERSQNMSITVVHHTYQLIPRKTIFIIRHGESKWNKAQAEKNLADMWGHVDHALDEAGIDQCRRFNSRWRALIPMPEVAWSVTLPPAKAHASKHRPSSLVEEGLAEVPEQQRQALEREFLNAQVAFASPLTRAFQTALLCLDGHQVLQRSGLHLAAIAREVKGLFGSDTKGARKGVAIRDHVARELTKMLGEPASNALMRTQIEFRDTVIHWWTSGKDTSADIQKRLCDLMDLLKYSDFQSGIVVGHSLFWLAFVKKFLRVDGSLPKLRRLLTSLKLGNCGCLALQVDFSGDVPVIMEAIPLFGTTFHA